MTLTETRAYNLIKKHGRMNFGQLGWMLWGDTTESVMRGTGSHGTNKFHRSAGKVIKSLKRQHRVRECHDTGHTTFIAI